MGKVQRAEYPYFRAFGQIRKAVNNPLPIPFPANCYSKGSDLLTLEIIDGLLQVTTICPAICANAWKKTHDLPGGRDVARYQAALDQLTEQDVPVRPLTAALQGLLPSLDTRIEAVYKNHFKPALILRPQMAEVAKKIKEELANQKKLMEGTLKNKPFSYYADLVVPDPAGGADLLAAAFVITIGSAGKAYQEYCRGKCAAGIIVEKGTKGIGGDKYVKFKGIEKREMFDALKNTGWNMKNLKKPDDLEKVG